MSLERNEKWHTDDDRHGLPYLKDYRVAQVTTHGHDRPIVPWIPTWKEFAGTMHRDNVPIPPQGSWAFTDMEGPGKIVNFWCTAAPTLDFNVLDDKFSWRAILRNWDSIKHLGPFDRFWNLLKNVWVQIYFDDSPTPAVYAPIGDFFGVGFGEYRHYMSRYLMMTAGGYVCQFHMPFRKKARVVLVNKNEKLWVPAFYGAVTYLQYRSTEPLEHQAYFHAAYREEAPTQRGQPFLILDTTTMGLAERPGHYVGVVLNTEGADKKAGFYFLEGNTKIWVDGETEQSLEYTGLEDYYQGAWYYVKTNRRDRTEFCAPYHGLTIKTLSRFGLVGAALLGRQKQQRLSQYRFHPEGIPFQNSIRITVHHGEFDEVAANFSSVAYWYQQPV
ncbi:MAG TPA: glycoside hydrolase family 172 protein [Anaerolineales bacterium]|nr:glycoside hydrolase family 172 protein [Anaerolineales bacterium]